MSLWRSESEEECGACMRVRRLRAWLVAATRAAPPRSRSAPACCWDRANGACPGFCVGETGPDRDRLHVREVVDQEMIDDALLSDDDE